MDRSLQKNGLINLLALLAVGVAGFAAARQANSLAGQVASVYFGLGLLVAAVSWFQMRLAERERLERLEFDELTKGKGGGASLFETKEAEVFPARRSREQFERYFVPGFTVGLFLLQAGGAILLWRWLAPKPTPGVKDALIVAGILAVCGLMLFIQGRFAVSLARWKENRLLQPGASHVLLSAFLCGTVALDLGITEVFGVALLDFYAAKVLSGVLGLIAAETLIALVLEIYRPRLKGKEARPLYESRLASLLGQPEGLLTTAAQTLDYQFGFKVSETWVYRFLAQAFGWILLLQFSALVLSTCVVFVDPGERALLERFGNPVAGRAVLGPGGHLKLPWPIDRVYRYRTEQLQSFVVGLAPGEEKEHERLVLWTVGHGKEDNFLVASRDPRGAETLLPAAGTNAPASKRSPPVSLLVVGIPVQYQVTNLTDWAYNNEDPTDLLQSLATREVVKYLVSVDTADIMSRGRLEAAEALRERIQAAANGRKLGAKITFVGLEDIHPPVKVAPEYEKVVSAAQQKEAKILAAQADAIRTNALADAQATRALNEASAERNWREVVARAQAALFTNQAAAWQAAPSVYTSRAYLQMFPRAVAGARKYVLLTTNTQDVIQIDLQDKISTDFLEKLAPPPTKPK